MNRFLALDKQTFVGLIGETKSFFWRMQVPVTFFNKSVGKDFVLSTITCKIRHSFFLFLATTFVLQNILKKEKEGWEVKNILIFGAKKTPNYEENSFSLFGCRFELCSDEPDKRPGFLCQSVYRYGRTRPYAPCSRCSAWHDSAGPRHAPPRLGCLLGLLL